MKNKENEQQTSIEEPFNQKQKKKKEMSNEKGRKN